MSKKRFTSLITLLALLGLSGLVSSAHAQTPTEDQESFPQEVLIQDIFLDAFTHHSGDFFSSTSFKGQFNLIFGFNQFPEKQIARDAQLVNILNRDFQRQTANNPPSRTRDLTNPFQSSIRENPYYIIPFTP